MVITFLPYEEFKKSAQCLDIPRLGKQRLEALWILQKNHIPSNRPSERLWFGYSSALAVYGMAICQEWMDRGYEDNMYEKFETYLGKEIILPKWLGCKELHDSHKSNLLRKNPEWYSKFNWNISNDLPYWWPHGNYDPRQFLFERAR